MLLARLLMMDIGHLHTTQHLGLEFVQTLEIMSEACYIQTPASPPSISQNTSNNEAVSSKNKSNGLNQEEQSINDENISSLFILTHTMTKT